MIAISIPGWRNLTLEHLVLDVNGTLAVDGVLLPGVKERLARLSPHLTIHLVTADTHGTQRVIDEQLGLKAHILGAVDQIAAKERFVEALGADGCAVIGNGMNDLGMMRRAALGLAVINAEGAAGPTLAAADVITAGIEEALDLLLKPARLGATLRR